MDNLIQEMKRVAGKIQMLERQRKMFEMGIINEYGSRTELEKLRKEFRSLQIKHKRLWMQS